MHIQRILVFNFVWQLVVAHHKAKSKYIYINIYLSQLSIAVQSTTFAFLFSNFSFAITSFCTYLFQKLVAHSEVFFSGTLHYLHNLVQCRVAHYVQLSCGLSLRKPCTMNIYIFYCSVFQRLACLVWPDKNETYNQTPKEQPLLLFSFSVSGPVSLNRHMLDIQEPGKAAISWIMHLY